MKQRLISRTEVNLIQQIATRASAMYLNLFDTHVDPAYIASELFLVHGEIVPLRLEEMLAADNSNFAHDIGGIHRHLKVGNPSELTGCFMPRFAVV